VGPTWQWRGRRGTLPREDETWEDSLSTTAQGNQAFHFDFCLPKKTEFGYGAADAMAIQLRSIFFPENTLLVFFCVNTNTLYITLDP
jgi:hypothetical protein